MKDSANELLKTYRAQAIVHGSASETGDYRTGNRAHDRLYRAYYGLRDVGAEQLLLDLLDDGDASVRGWAGMHCLFINERKAKRALGGVARGNGIVASCAQMVLAQWRIGELELAPRTGKAPRKRKSKRGLTKRRRPPKREPARGANRDVTGDAEE